MYVSVNLGTKYTGAIYLKFIKNSRKGDTYINLLKGQYRCTTFILNYSKILPRLAQEITTLPMSCTLDFEVFGHKLRLSM